MVLPCMSRIVEAIDSRSVLNQFDEMDVEMKAWAVEPASESLLYRVSAPEAALAPSKSTFLFTIVAAPGTHLCVVRIRLGLAA